MNRLKTFFLTAILCLIWYIPVNADIPRYLSYQGKLTDTAGTPVADGSYVITFRLYNAQTEGALLWTETQSVSIADGAFAVTLGTITPLDLTFDTEYWLSVQIKDDTQMRPRQRMTSAGYSINADKLDNVTSDQFLRSDTNDTASGQITLSYPGTALVVQPSSAPGANTKLLEIKDSTGSSKCYIDYEGDISSQNATVSGKINVTGTTTLSSTLDVNGATTLSGILEVTGAAALSNNLDVSGSTTLSGDLRLQGRIRQGALGDLAEMMPLASCIIDPPDIQLWEKEVLAGNSAGQVRIENKNKYFEDLFTLPEPADVVVISPEGGVRRCFEPLAKNTAGIVSTNPAQILHDDLKNAVPIALSGVVPCKVTNENGTILPGDLLASSSLPGHAMKAPDNSKPGTIIGKALEKFEEKSGIIDVLVIMH